MHPMNETLSSEIREFRLKFRSVLMATANEDGVPEASYAPYVIDDAGHYYIYVSELSRHTRNLTQTGRVSLLFIEDEQSAANIFAQTRCGCLHRRIPRTNRNGRRASCPTSFPRSAETPMWPKASLRSRAPRFRRKIVDDQTPDFEHRSFRISSRLHLPR